MTGWRWEETRELCHAELLLTAEASASSFDIDVLRHLRLHQQQNHLAADAEYIIKVFDDFDIKGPNGTHRCVVAELLRPSIDADSEEVYVDGKLPFEIRKRIAAQASGRAWRGVSAQVRRDTQRCVLLACSDVGCCHSITSIQISISATSSYTPPKWMPSPPPSSNCLASPANVHVEIYDFGEAFLYGVHRPSWLNTPRVYAAPEVIFCEPVRPPTDVWALAVLIHMIISNHYPLFHSPHGIEKEVVYEMILILGILPERWWTRWAGRAVFFDENGAFVGNREGVKRMAGVFVKHPVRRVMGVQDVAAFEQLLRSMVRYEMEDSITAEDVVRLIPAACMGAT